MLSEVISVYIIGYTKLGKGRLSWIRLARLGWIRLSQVRLD
jgi:hypothetical protein